MSTTEAKYSVTFKGREPQYKESLWTARGDVLTEFLEHKAGLLEAYEDHYGHEASRSVAQALDATEVSSAPLGMAEAVADAPNAGVDICKGCDEPKDKWVPAGFSKRTNKPYDGFFACNTRGCKGGR